MLTPQDQKQLKIDEKQLSIFIEAISQKYVVSNPYHNWHHGVVVTHVTFLLLQSPQLKAVFTDLERLGERCGGE